MKSLMLFLVLLLLNNATLGQQLNKDEPVRFLALGDSYTIGQGVSETERWPNQLAKVMEEMGYNIEEVRIIARTGWRTDDLMTAINEEDPDSSYNLVSLLIGVNNQYQGVDFNLYYNDFNELLSRAIALCGGQKSGVFVLSIPDYGYTPFGASDRETISSEIDQYNDTNRRITLDRGVKYINITSISREAEDKPEYLASDNLHPSGLMYARWVDEVTNYLNLGTATIINKSQFKNNETLYPNPASKLVNWNAEKPNVSVSLFNSQGIQVIKKDLSGLKKLELDVSAISPGIYAYRILMADNSILTGKLIIR